MHKTFLETRLQLLLSPAVLYSTDSVLRPLESRHLQQGFLVLSALQVRGHAMFSPTGRAIDEETIEYAWMIEATLGQLTGRMTLPQLQHVTAGLEVFLRLARGKSNDPSTEEPNCLPPPVFFPITLNRDISKLSYINIIVRGDISKMSIYLINYKIDIDITYHINISRFIITLLVTIKLSRKHKIWFHEIDFEKEDMLEI